MNALRRIVSLSTAVLMLALIGGWRAVESQAQTPNRAALTGAWTLNPDLSDKPDRGGRGGGREGADGGGRRGGRGGTGGGGRGGGMRGGGRGGRGAARGNQDEMARMRDAMRDVMTASKRLTITQTDVMVLITSAEGRTTRLSPTNKKIKDESTGIERKSWWEGAQLVSEIAGLGPGKITETYAIDPAHQLQVTVQMEGGRGQQRATTMHRVYDADAR